MHLLRLISVLVIGTLIEGFHPDPCSSYTTKTGQYQRSHKYTLQSNDIAISDNFLSEGWYRFDSGAGNDMVTQAPSITQCGTIYPIWLQGDLPSDADGEVNRTACIVGFAGPCSKTIKIQVKSCGNFRVYHLVPAPQTSTGYCIGGKLPCPEGQTSETGFTPCQDFITKSTNPFVKVSLEKKRNSTMSLFKPVEPVFKCLFDEPSGGPYWYDTIWYINKDTVKVVKSQLHNSNQSWLYPNDWVDNYDLNMVVKCSVRVRQFEKGIPGHHNYSENFPAGMFPSSFSHELKEGEMISIKLTVTVPIGCFDINRQKNCKTSIFLQTPEYRSSTNSCKPLSNQGDLAFDEKGCGIVIESSTWWEEKILNVTGKSDRLINYPKDRNLNIKLGSKTNSPEDPSKVWYNFTMPDIKIRLYDKDDHMINKLCSADTDPRMKTFDGKSWTASLAGEFVMYRDTKRRIAVHALFSSCQWGGQGHCGCGIAVRVENSLFAYRTCERISNHYSKPLIHHDTVYHICDDRHMVVDIGNQYSSITLPNGAQVKYRIGRNWLYEIHVTPSIFDEGNVEGLCGNPNNDSSDDFNLQESGKSTLNSSVFQASWRVDINSTESLFGPNAVFNNNSFELPRYCDCAEEIKDNENSISKYHTAKCSVASSAIMCSQTTPNSLTSTCTHYQNRYKRNSIKMDFKRLVQKRSAESDEVIEIMPLTIDPSFDPDFIPPTPSWKNGWNELTARKHCENIILNNPARISCQNYIPMKESTDISIEQCVLDIRDSGSTEFSKYTLESLNHFCLDQIKRYEKYHAKNGFKRVSVVDAIGKLVCPNDCSSRGVCNKGQCKCRAPYIGVDCSLTASTPPTSVTLPENGLCKTSKRACKKTNIFGFFHSEVVYAKLEEFEITDLGKTDRLSTATLKTTHITPTILRINLPTINLRRRSSYGNLYGIGFYISLSYDNMHFGESMPIVIFNDVCYTCSASTLECNITRTCEDSSSSQNINIKKEKEGNDISLALITALCIVSVIILAVVCVLLYLKIRTTTCLSPKNDIKSPSSKCGECSPHLTETTNTDSITSQPPNYESLSPSSFITT